MEQGLGEGQAAEPLLGVSVGNEDWHLGRSLLLYLCLQRRAYFREGGKLSCLPCSILSLLPFL